MPLLKLPISTKDLAKWIPHRDPMVWIDEVVTVEPAFAICRVGVDKNRAFCDQSGLRPSAYIEWMAQAYAFSEAARKILEVGEGQVAALNKAYLVAITKAEFPEQKATTSVSSCLVR